MSQHKNIELDPWTGHPWDPAVFEELFPEVVMRQEGHINALPQIQPVNSLEREEPVNARVSRNDKVRVASPAYWGDVSIADHQAVQRRIRP